MIHSHKASQLKFLSEFETCSLMGFWATQKCLYLEKYLFVTNKTFIFVFSISNSLRQIQFWSLKWVGTITAIIPSILNNTLASFVFHDIYGKKSFQHKYLGWICFQWIFGTRSFSDGSITTVLFFIKAHFPLDLLKKCSVPLKLCRLVLNKSYKSLHSGSKTTDAAYIKHEPFFSLIVFKRDSFTYYLGELLGVMFLILVHKKKKT